MTLEEHLFAVLAPLVSGRVFPDIAPLNTPKPYLTYQLIGGPNTRWLDRSAPDKRRSIVQINSWGAQRTQVNGLARAVEDAMCATALFTATPEGEPTGDHEPDVVLPDAPFGIYGALQDFHVISDR